MFKRTVLIIAVCLFASNGWGVPVYDVSGTRHNLSATSTGPAFENYLKATDEDEVCIFCHTPHGGALNTPLWNRGIPLATGFTHYKSATLSTTMGSLSQSRDLKPESLLCMSCHDGSVAMSNITNYSNRLGAQPDNAIHKIQPMWGDPAAVIGDARIPGDLLNTTHEEKNLSDDHPVSFSYYDVAVLESENNGKLHPALLVNSEDPRKKGLKFFDDTEAAGGQRVECSTCHDPHINDKLDNGGDPAYTPFLRMPNTGSALCLACHIK